MSFFPVTHPKLKPRFLAVFTHLQQNWNRNRRLLPGPLDTMQLWGSLLLLTVALSDLGIAVPVEDSPRQRLLNGLPLPPAYQKKKAAAPYTPGNRDPLDRAIDAVGDKLDPLPWRNGLGASVLGPWNMERSRQSPDLVRPPSTDHGNLANMRWSFADSHIRIEVRLGSVPNCSSQILTLHRKADGRDRPPFESWALVSSSPA